MTLLAATNSPVGAETWTPLAGHRAPSSTMPSRSSWLGPSVLAYTLGLLPGSFVLPLHSCSAQSGALAVLRPGLGAFFCPHLSTGGGGRWGLTQALGWLPGLVSGTEVALLWHLGSLLPSLPWLQTSDAATHPRWLLGLHPELHTAHVSGGFPLTPVAPGLGLEPWRAPCQSLPRLEPQFRAGLGFSHAPATGHGSVG